MEKHVNQFALFWHSTWDPYKIRRKFENPAKYL